METKHKYWILFSILFIALIWTIKNKHQKEMEEGFANNNEYDYITDIEAARVQLSNLLGLLLDDQLFANQIIIDYNLISVIDASSTTCTQNQSGTVSCCHQRGCI